MESWQGEETPSPGRAFRLFVVLFILPTSKHPRGPWAPQQPQSLLIHVGEEVLLVKLHPDSVLLLRTSTPYFDSALRFRTYDSDTASSLDGDCQTGPQLVHRTDCLLACLPACLLACLPDCLVATRGLCLELHEFGEIGQSVPPICPSLPEPHFLFACCRAWIGARLALAHP